MTKQKKQKSKLRNNGACKKINKKYKKKQKQKIRKKQKQKTKNRRKKTKTKTKNKKQKSNNKQKQLEHLSDLVKNKKYNCMHKPTKYKKHLKRN